VLERNDRLSIMYKINGILGENGAMEGEEDTAMDNNDMTLLKYAPFTLCDIARSFSQYKTILSDSCRSFSFENLYVFPVIHCNAFWS
jgi:hypothetical protein